MRSPMERQRAAPAKAETAPETRSQRASSVREDLSVRLATGLAVVGDSDWRGRSARSARSLAKHRTVPPAAGPGPAERATDMPAIPATATARMIAGIFALFDSWLPIRSGSGLMARHARQIDLQWLTAHLKEDRPGAALPMYFSRNAAAPVSRIRDLRLCLPQAEEPAMYFWCGALRSTHV